MHTFHLYNKKEKILNK